MSDIVLLPGFMCNEELWDRARPDLDKLGSLYFGDLTKDRTFEDMARRVLDDAPERFDLVGFSMGGFVAREIALMAPERVRKLALVNTSARGDSPDQAERKARLAKAAEARGFRGLSHHAILSSLHPDRREDAGLVQHIKDMANRIGKEGFVNQIGVVRKDGHPRLAEIAAPTLVVWSCQDELRSLDEARELAEGIPNARLETVDACGHMLPIEVPESMVGLLRAWLG